MQEKAIEYSSCRHMLTGKICRNNKSFCCDKECFLSDKSDEEDFAACPHASIVTNTVRLLVLKPEDAVTQ